MDLKPYAGPAIPRGHEFAMQIGVVSEDGQPVFPSGCKLRSEVLVYLSSSEAIAVLTTENAGITRIDDDTILIRMLPEQTAQAEDGSVTMDVVRTDVTPNVYLYVQLVIPVIEPRTKAVAP